MAEQNVFLNRLKERELWKVLEKKSENCSDYHGYMDGMEKVCKFAADRSVTIRDTFPMYTRHDEQHILNVIKLMENLLGDRLKELNRDEAAMLILAACCHDIGMSCSKQEKEYLLKSEHMKIYLNTHDSEYLKAYPHGGNEPVITDDIFRNFLRSIHHEHIGELLYPIWPSALDDLYTNLIWVCKSHGKSCLEIEASVTASESDADLRLCAVLLRLADILDFDTTRAPQAIYDYCGFGWTENPEANKSKEEWDKHIASKGFSFEKVKKRDIPYELPYRATCCSMNIEQAVNSYLDWVDQELTDCSITLRKDESDWKNLVLPNKVKRSIKSKGYLSGQYIFTLDQSQVLNLLGGEELYSDPAAFVRELLQNAIDAVRTREAFDHEAKRHGWKPQINIRTWTDKDGDWFRIEDNGTGMTKEIIENHLLKVGSSYYNSDEFKKEKLLSRVDDYTPISRFGIGILSCFMGDKEHSCVEISTKWYRQENKSTITPSLRLRMDGLSGYYAMYTNEKDDNHPGEMPGCSDNEKQEYRTEPGTVVAVRTNLYRTGKYHGFKEIVDKWLVFPPVPVHYEGPDDECNYSTQEEFMDSIRNFAHSDDLTKDGVMDFPLSEPQLDEIRKEFPGINISDATKLVLKCVDLECYSRDLERYSRTKSFSGALLAFEIEPKIEDFLLDRGGELLDECMSVNYTVTLDYNKSTLELYLSIYDYCDPDFKQTITIVFPIQEKMPWYKYFQQTLQHSMNCSVTAHNGIVCGNADFICNEWNQNAILLLRDGYRPEMNLKRNNIQRLSLEFLFICELIMKQLKKEGFFTHPSDRLYYFYRFSSSQEFLSMLENHTDWLEQLIVDTKEGAFTLVQLNKTLQNKKELLLNIDKYFHYYGHADNYLYNHLIMAHLQDHYALHLNKDLSEVIIQEGQPNHLYDGWKLFPPCFFIPVKDENCTYFTRAYKHERCCCNAGHPLSKFLLSKAKDIKSKSPGCFDRIVSAIAEEDELISVLNDQLNILKNIPDNPLGVMDDLMLEESDLI